MAVPNIIAATPFQANVSMDASGNFNHWFPNGIGMFTGSAYDTMTDVPADSSNVAANWNVLSSAAIGTVSPSNGGLTLAQPTTAHTALRGTMPLPTTGKFYFEGISVTATANQVASSIGLATNAASLTVYPGSTTGTYAVYASSSGMLVTNGSTSLTLSTFPANAVLQVAYDAVTGNLWLGINNAWYDSAGGTTGNPSTGANPSMVAASSLGLYPYFEAYANTINVNFGQQPLSYTPPTGFGTLNTYTSAVATLWWGNGSTYPDLTWIKSRSAATSHMLMDTTRGSSLFSNSNNGNPQYGSGGAYNWSKYGLVLANDGNTNVAGNTYVLWGWTAGQGNAVVNSSGSISSTVSANPTAGFSIVNYTGSGIPSTVGHGLGVAPSMIIFKNLSQSTSWIVYHSSISPNYLMVLNVTNAQQNLPAYFNNTASTSAVFSIGSAAATGSDINAVNNPYVAYCWASVPGYSAFGTFTGNGSTDGPFVFCGFRPRWILIKGSTLVSDWVILDTARNTYNAATSTLFPDLTAAETTGSSYPNIDILSNGFKMRTSSAYDNNSGDTYIYAAFAENPFKYALAR